MKTTRYGVLVDGVLMPTTHLSRAGAYASAVDEERRTNLSAEVVTLEVTILRDFSNARNRTHEPDRTR